MSIPSRSRRVHWLFLTGLWLPLLAALLSPQIGIFVSRTWTNPAAFDEELNRLRQRTPLWNGAVSFYNRTLYAAGTSGRPGAVEAGRFGWLFLGDIFNKNFSQALGRRVLDDDEVARWTATLRLQARWLSQRKIGSAFIVAPAKWSIYPDHLPWWTQDLHPVHSLDRILTSAADSLPLVDLRPALVEARHHADTYSALDSHWTGYGAYVAWARIAAELPLRVPGLPEFAVPSLAGASVGDSHNEFAGMLGLFAPNDWTNYVLQQPMNDIAIVDADGQETVLPGGSATDLLELPRTTLNERAANRLRVLVLRDSTGNSLSPFLQNAFYMAYQVDHRLGYPGTWPDLAGLVEQFHPDLVLWIMTERYLNEPLGDLEYWQAATTYDCAASGDQWPDSGDGRPLDVDGGLSLHSPMHVSIPASTQPRVMRISLDAGAEGVLVVSGTATAGGVARVRYGAGRNELFVRVSESMATTAATLGIESGEAPRVDAIGLRAFDAHCGP